MNSARHCFALAMLACCAPAGAQSLAVRVDAPDWGQVQAVHPIGSQGTAWTEQCYAAGIQDHASARYLDGRGRVLGSKGERQAWLASISSDDLVQGRLGPVVRLNENMPAARQGQVVLRADQQGTLERDLACLAYQAPMGEVVGHDVVVVSGGRQFRWHQLAGVAAPAVGAWVRPPAGAIMSGYAPGHTPPAPPRGDWSDSYYIGYPYAERYQAPVVVDDGH